MGLLVPRNLDCGNSSVTLQKMTPVFLSKADLDVALRDADAARKQEQSETYSRSAKKHREDYDAAKKEARHFRLCLCSYVGAMNDGHVAACAH